MKRMGVLFSIAALLAFALAAAPDATAQKNATAQKKKTGGGVHSMIGCLQKGEGSTFVLTNVEGAGPKTVEIVASTLGTNLTAHVGHKVEITGTALDAKQAARAEGTKKKDERSEHYMRVDSVRMLGTTCRHF
jgi:hypothetical protein